MTADLGVRPLTARSLVLTVMLGNPPRLSASALVALGELFGISPGTTRTALSRMVAEGELVGDGGGYELGARMLQRRSAQDVSRHPVIEPWDGTWWFALVVANRRSLAARRVFRSRMNDSHMAELAPGQWTRPANIAGPADDSADVLVTRGGVGCSDPVELAGRLWDLDGLSRRGRMLLEVAAEARALIDTGDPLVLPRTIIASIAVFRYLRADPQLPVQLVGDAWPTERLRNDYDELERGHGRVFRSIFSNAG